MASILRVNTLTDASSNNSTAMSTIFNGTAKAWAFALDNAISDDFNIASTTDNDTGDYTFTFTSAMANSTFAVTAMVNEDSNLNVYNWGRATTSYNLAIKNSSGTSFDKNSGSVVHGDLA
jgi:hypothetical protein